MMKNATQQDLPWISKTLLFLYVGLVVLIVVFELLFYFFLDTVDFVSSLPTVFGSAMFASIIIGLLYSYLMRVSLVSQVRLVLSVSVSMSYLIGMISLHFLRVVSLSEVYGLFLGVTVFLGVVIFAALDMPVLGVNKRK